MIRYYPDIIYQNKHIQAMQKKLGYTKKSSQKAIASATPKGKAGWNPLMALFQQNKPSKEQFKASKHAKGPGNRLMFGPGWMPMTLGNLYTKTDIIMSNNIKHNVKALDEMKAAKTSKAKKQAKRKYMFWLGLVQHGMSLCDLTPQLYDFINDNPNTISYWFPPLMKAYDQSNHFFKVPKTKIWTMPIEVAQYLHNDYQMTNAKSRDMFNRLVFDAFDLDKDKSYFIKTGVFSGKYEFRNAHCKEPLEMGEYFHVINNFAMNVGAASSVDLCVRQWIPDPEHRPTIYHGMPLRTEFRSFVDFDHDKIIGIVPYWNPLVMDRVLQMQGQNNPAILKDYHTYRKCIPSMMKEYNAAVPVLHEQLNKLIPKVHLHGQWSLDIMKSGKNYYLIDMALMANSALKELLPKYHF